VQIDCAQHEDVSVRFVTFGVVTLNGAGFLLYWRANGSE